MSHPPFVHLHLHTQYSLLDGAIRLEDLFQKVVEYEMPAVSMTDHGSMFGAIDFYRKAREKEVKPIIGCEMYVAPGSRHDKSLSRGQSNHHLVLLAENYRGYQNLCALLTKAYFEGFYYKPRIDLELLAEHKEGLIALSACLHGEVAEAALHGDANRALAVVRQYQNILGVDNFFVEVQDAGIEEQRIVNEVFLELGARHGVPLVATNDCHYLNREDSRVHDVLLCIQTGKTVKEDDRLKFTTDELYFKSPEEMIDKFKRFPGAIENTLKIAERCNIEIPLNETHMPVFDLPPGESAEEILEKKAWKGLEERLDHLRSTDPAFDAEKEKSYRERLEIELDVIKKMGFPGYFLIVSDFIGHAREMGIPVGPGRGSAAGSLVAYAVRITNIDPLLYGLLFERFLNVERKSMPDIDIDFCMDRREEVIAYVSDKYGGQDRVSQIITFGKLKPRAVIRDVGRALDMPYGDVDRIAKLIPNDLKITIEKAILQESRLRDLEQNDPQVKELLTVAKALEGLPRHASTHAAGVIISDRPLVDYLPLYKGPNNEVMTQFDMGNVERVGLIKFDFLGLKTLTVIQYALKTIEERNGGKKLILDDLPMDDAPTYELLCKGDTTGVFQLESSGMKDLLRRMRPACFEDIIALVALYRPGPMESGMISDFVRAKHGEQEIVYPLPQLESILKETYGVIVYQEQVMQIANVLAGYSLGDADILRRAMGKKKPELMAAEKAKFLKGADEKKVDRKKAEEVFDLMEKFAGYGFNKSHSAAYGLIAYQTGYLKAHYPVEFMAALLTCDINNTNNVVKFISECREMGIKILPPDVNESDKVFTVVDEGIRFGLAAVKNVGAGAIDSVLEVRKEGGRFVSLFDFCERVDLRKVNKRVIESLIKAGAFDFLGAKRAQLFAAMDEAMAHAQAFQRDRMAGQVNLFDVMSSQTPEARAEPALPQIEEWRERQKLAYEKEALGFYITGHPLDQFETELALIASTRVSELQYALDGETARVGGVSGDVKTILTKKGERMGFFPLEDREGSVEVVVFSDLYAQNADLIESDEPLLVTAKVNRDENGIKLTAQEIMALKNAQEKYTNALDIKLKSWELDEQRLQEFRELLISHKGTCETRLVVEIPDMGETVFSLPQSMWVHPDRAMVREVNHFLGYEAVRAKV